MVFVRHEPCPKCGSKNNVGVWVTEGGREQKYCFSCEELLANAGTVTKKKDKDKQSTKTSFTWPIEGSHIAPLLKRGLTASTCQEYGIYQRKKVLYFPSLFKGRVSGYKKRDFTLPKEDDFHFVVVGQYTQHMFGWSTVSTKRIVAIAMGELDAASVKQATGIPCLSPPSGDKSLLGVVKKDYREFEQFEKIVFVPDMEELCVEWCFKTAEVLGEERCFIAALTYKDPSEYLQQRQPSLLKEHFWAARSMAGGYFYDDVGELVKPVDTGIPSGCVPLDMLLHGFRKQETTYVIGAPKQGKTTFVLSIISNLVKADVKVASLVLEGSHQRFVTKLTDHLYKGSIFTAHPSAYQTIVSKLKRNLIVPKLRNDATTSEISRVVTAAVKVFSCQIVVVDNITTLGSGEETKEYCLTLDRLALELNIPIVVISHMTRGGYDEPPTLSSAASTSFIERLASNVIGLHRNKGSSVLRVEILKNREIGQEGEGFFRLDYDKHSMTYEEFQR